jgi:hypothetical protein
MKGMGGTMVSCPQFSPFGILFQEHAPQPAGAVAAVYDARTDISYLRSADGRLLPYVEAASMGTDTAPKVLRETTDADAEDEHAPMSGAVTLVGTDTFTKEEKEATDKD